MALSEDLALHVRLHMDRLKNLQNGVPAGLRDQLTELSEILATYEADITKIETDRHLSPDGKAAKRKAAYESAQSAVETWRASRTGGTDAHLAAQHAVLQSHADKLLPRPTDLQVQNMVQRLSSFDPAEVEVLYGQATDAERRIIEAAAEAIGRQPRKRSEQLLWEPLIPPERVAATVAERIERADPDGAAGLYNLQEVRRTYDAVAGAAAGLLRGSLRDQGESAPVV